MATSTGTPAPGRDSAASAEREWSGADGSCRISISNRMLEELRFEASRAMNGPGGQGVGGVLLGTRQGDHFKIAGFVPIACKHAFGPEFRLSQLEESELPAFLDGLKIGAGPEDPRPLGWLVSHPRGDLAIRADEREFHQRFFGNSQLMIIAKPDRLGDMELAVHYAKGETASGLSLVEPVLSVVPDASFRLARRTATARRHGAELPMPRANQKRITAPPRVQFRTRPAKAHRSGLLVAILLLFVLASVCGGLYWSRQRAARIAAAPRGPQAPIEMLSLHAYETGKRFYISWDGKSAAIRRAAKTALFIHDAGTKKRYELSGDEASSGVYVYSRTGNEVKVTLEVEGLDGGVIEESTHYATSEFNAPEMLRLAPDSTAMPVLDPSMVAPSAKKF